MGVDKIFKRWLGCLAGRHRRVIGPCSAHSASHCSGRIGATYTLRFKKCRTCGAAAHSAAATCRLASVVLLHQNAAMLACNSSAPLTITSPCSGIMHSLKNKCCSCWPSPRMARHTHSAVAHPAAWFIGSGPIRPRFVPTPPNGQSSREVCRGGAIGAGLRPREWRLNRVCELQARTRGGQPPPYTRHALGWHCP